MDGVGVRGPGVAFDSLGLAALHPRLIKSAASPLPLRLKFSRFPSPISHLPFVICHLSFVICHLSFCISGGTADLDSRAVERSGTLGTRTE